MPYRFGRNRDFFHFLTTHQDVPFPSFSSSPSIYSRDSHSPTICKTLIERQTKNQARMWMKRNVFSNSNKKSSTSSILEISSSSPGSATPWASWEERCALLQKYFPPHLLIFSILDLQCLGSRGGGREGPQDQRALRPRSLVSWSQGIPLSHLHHA